MSCIDFDVLDNSRSKRVEMSSRKCRESYSGLSAFVRESSKVESWGRATCAADPSLKEELTLGSGFWLRTKRDKAVAERPFERQIDSAADW